MKAPPGGAVFTCFPGRIWKFSIFLVLCGEAASLFIGLIKTWERSPRKRRAEGLTASTFFQRQPV